MTTSGIIISSRKVRTKCGTIFDHIIKPYQSIGDTVILILTAGGKLVDIESTSCKHEHLKKKEDVIEEKTIGLDDVDYSQLDSIE